MVDNLRKVGKGTPTSPRIVTASTWNAFIDAAKANLNKDPNPVGPLSGQFTQNQNGLIRVQNNSGVEVPAFSVLGVDGLIFDPITDATAFSTSDFISSQFLIDGVLPDVTKHKFNFVVTQNKIEKDGIGIARMSGLTVGKINFDSPITTAEIYRAGIENNNTASFKPATYGAEIMFISEDEIPDESFVHYVILKLGRTLPTAMIPGKTKEAIDANDPGDVIEILADGTEKGEELEAVNKGSDIAISKNIVIGYDSEGNAFFLPGESAGGGTQGNFWIEFTDDDSHKFFIEGTMDNQGVDIISELMLGGPGISMDGGGAASGKVTLKLGGDLAGDTWDFTTPDGNATGNAFSGSTLTNINVGGGHNWSNTGFLVQENIPDGTNLPPAWGI